MVGSVMYRLAGCVMSELKIVSDWLIDMHIITQTVTGWLSDVQVGPLACISELRLSLIG